MNWFLASLVSLLAWSLFGFYNRRAVVVHGWQMNIVIQTIVYIALSIGAVALTEKGVGVMFGQVTRNSSWNAVLGSVLGVAGLLFFTVAMQKVPSDKETMVVILITGMFPVLGMLMGKIFFGLSMNPVQWAGVALAGVALVLVNWK